MSGVVTEVLGSRHYIVRWQVICGNETHRPAVETPYRAQLFEDRLALNPGLNLTWVSFSYAQKHFHGQFSLLFLRVSNHQLLDKKN